MSSHINETKCIFRKIFYFFYNFIKDFVVPVLINNLGGALGFIGKVAGGILDVIGAVVNGIKSAVNFAIDAINVLIRAYNAVPLLSRM